MAPSPMTILLSGSVVCVPCLLPSPLLSILGTGDDLRGGGMGRSNGTVGLKPPYR
jgi:hypothetical protein